MKTFQVGDVVKVGKNPDGRVSSVMGFIGVIKTVRDGGERYLVDLDFHNNWVKYKDTNKRYRSGKLSMSNGDSHGLCHSYLYEVKEE